MKLAFCLGIGACLGLSACIDLGKVVYDTPKNPGFGTGASCTLSSQCSSGVCDTGECAAPACDDNVLNGAETDIDCGSTCPPCSSGGHCSTDVDCASHSCQKNVCAVLVGPECTNGVKDGNETDVDCGGSCQACANDRACAQALDCINRICVKNLCIAPGCNNQVKDGSESDVDCGGTCAPCDIGGACASDNDCASEFCALDSLTCQSSCSDGAHDGGETGSDCGGLCHPCPAGSACDQASDCWNGQCTSGSCSNACPSSMSLVPLATVGPGYCMDKTEVSWGSYAAWLATAPSTSGRPDYCAWNSNFDPNQEASCSVMQDASGSGAHLPAACIDFCDATAYCVDHGLHLCGAVAGTGGEFDNVPDGPAADDRNDPDFDQWYNACSGSGAGNTYCYGDPYMANFCIDTGGTLDPMGPAAVDRPSNKCVATSAAVYDLDGNIGEWENACDSYDPSTATTDACTIRGGAYNLSAANTKCVRAQPHARGEINNLLGFRCCAL